MRETSLRRSRTCWKTLTRSTSETTSSPFGAFVVVEGFVGLGPDVFFDLLLLVEELGGVFIFFVFDETLDEFGAGVGGCSSGSASGSGGRSILDLM